MKDTRHLREGIDCLLRDITFTTRGNLYIWLRQSVVLKYRICRPQNVLAGRQTTANCINLG